MSLESEYSDEKVVRTRLGEVNVTLMFVYVSMLTIIYISVCVHTQCVADELGRKYVLQLCGFINSAHY